jgi:YVTN family beta-propeller protein
VQFGILGPLEVLRDGRRVELGGAQQRALLAVLLLHRGEVVSVDRLTDELWGEGAPPTAHKTVQVYVSRLRKVLGDGLLVTRADGYLLAVESDEIDAERFERLMSEAREALEGGDQRRRAGSLVQALGLWRGPPLEEFAYERFAQAAIARLQEARLSAIEERIDAELELGEHGRLVGELEALVREHPLNERFEAQLMRALYQSGRQADALESYRGARRRLIDELGIEPGRRLQELERAILAQDPSLEAPAPGPARHRAGRTQHGELLLALGGGALLAVIAVVAVVLNGAGPALVPVAPNSVAAIDVQSNRVAATVPVGSSPGPLTFGAGSLWVSNIDDQTVSRIDPATLRTLRTITVRGPPTGIAAAAQRIWVVQSNAHASTVSVSRVDPRFNSVEPVSRIANVVPGGPGAAAVDGDAVWIAPSAGRLVRLDPGDGHALQHIDPNLNPAGIALGDGVVWLTDTNADTVTRIDPTGLRTTIPVGGGPGGIAVGGGGVWVADALDDTVVRINPGTAAVTMTIRVGHSPSGVAVGAGSVWVANSGDGTVTRIDTRSYRVQSTIAVGGSPQSVAIAHRRAWVTIDPQAVSPVHSRSGATLRVETNQFVDSLDPALAYSRGSAQLLYATCAKLLNYPDRSGAAGEQLTPEVAQAMPEPSNNGRTYTFTIRPGFRFSPPSGEPVTADTFRDTIERTLNPRMKNPVAFEFTNIVGASAYMAGRARHISGVVAHGNTLAIRLRAPEPDILSRLSQPFFCAVPSGTPIDPMGVREIPAAGPYYVTSYTPGREVAQARNPNYGGSRSREFQRIEMTLGTSPQQAAADVEAGRADYTIVSGPTGSDVTALTSRLAARFGAGSAAAARGHQQYYATPQPGLDYLALNTHRPLFSDVRMRRAVNYAIDRRALAKLGLGSTSNDRPTDQYLPPGLPGSISTRVYPLTSDPAKARALAHGTSATAILYTCDGSSCKRQAEIIKTELAAIGLRVHIRTFNGSTMYARLARPGEPVDMVVTGWAPDYPDPEAMLNGMIENPSTFPALVDRGVPRRLAAAARLTGAKRYLTYGKLAIELARDDAPLVAYGTSTNTDFFSARIGCQTYSFYTYVDLAALCAKPTS